MMEISPCPKCGNPPWWESAPKYDLDFDGDFQIWVYLECLRCSLQTDSYPEEEKAIEAWNNRNFSK